MTLLFSLSRYAEIIEAYLSGLEKFAANGGDPSTVSSVASFFVSRVDTEVDQRLEAVGTDEALALRGQAAVAQAKLAYRLFTERFSCQALALARRHGSRYPASTVGLDVHEESRRPRHPLCRGTHRPRHCHDFARGNHRRLRGSWHVRRGPSTAVYRRQPK